MASRHRSRPRPAATTTKAMGRAGAITFTAAQVQALVDQRAGTTTNTSGVVAPLPRDNSMPPFGPGTPLFPQGINPPRPDSGRPEPRQYEYPVALNLPGFGERLIPWSVLRDAADRIPLFRRCIEIRKNEVATLDWDIVISPKAIERAQRADTGRIARVDLERQMRQRLEPEIARTSMFWETPDRRNGHNFVAWAKQVLEEHFVLDAVPIYPRGTLGGQLYGFEVIDGSTIKPLIDQYGGRPLPPQPAYQQVLYGFPRGEFVADVAGDGTIPGAYPSDRLIYNRANVRTWTPYGLSPVEQALEDGALYLRRMQWMMAEYTDGVMPAGWLLAGEGQAQWSADQLREYNRSLNDMLSGNTTERFRFQILPWGMKPDEGQSDSLAERYKPDYDLHLIKLVASHFDTTLPELGFSEAKGLGSDGWSQGQADVQERKGTRPTLTWLQGLVTGISRTYLGMPMELEFRFAGLSEEDDAAKEEVEGKRQGMAVKTLNERRDDLGLTRYTFAEADMPMLVTQRGVVFLDGAATAAQPGQLIQPAQAPPAGEQDPDNPDGGDDGDDEPGTGKPQGKAKPDVVKGELRAYNRWLAKGVTARRFELVHVDQAAAVAAGVDLGRVTFKSGGGGADPKVVDARHWPGWAQDEAAAKHWATKISQALSGAVPTRQVAENWLSARKAADPARLLDAQSWLADQPLNLGAVYARILPGLWTDGYLIGSLAAAAMLPGDKVKAATVSVDVDWGAWTPGDTQAAEKILTEQHYQDRLYALLQRVDGVAGPIALSRVDDLARILADGLEHGQSVDTLAGRLEQALADPDRAYRVAVTETTRAVSAATLDRYRANQVPATEWLVAADQHVCAYCTVNGDQGPVPVGTAYESGDYAPPAHPLCRCAIAPAYINEPTTATTPAEDRAARRAAARERNRHIESRDAVARFLAEVDQAVAAMRSAGTLDAKVLAERIASARTAGVAEEAVAEVEAAANTGDLEAVDAAVQRTAAGHDLTPIGRAGETVAYDPAVHESIAEDVTFAEGDQVRVWRQGHQLTMPDASVVQLDRAVVKSPPVTIVPATDGLDAMLDHSLRSLAGEFGIPEYSELDRAELLAQLRDRGAVSPDRLQAMTEEQRASVFARQVELAARHVDYQPDLTGIEDLAELVANDFPGALREQFEGGSVGTVEKITMPDGRRFFSKVSGLWANRTGETVTDAEQLAAAIGRAIEAPVPRVVRASADRIFTDWAEGRAGETWYDNQLVASLDGPPDNDFLRGVVDSGPGHRLGLLDMLVQNTDRHSLNWLVDVDGTLTGVDHGNAWWYAGRAELALDDAAFAEKVRGDLIGPFVRDLFFDQAELEDTGVTRLIDSTVMTPDDVVEIRSRLEALRPDFARLGHETWLNYSLRVLDLIEPYAKGSRSIFDD